MEVRNNPREIQRLSTVLCFTALSELPIVSYRLRLLHSGVSGSVSSSFATEADKPAKRSVDELVGLPAFDDMIKEE